MNPAVVCAIGTTDPWNAAGIGRDIAVLALRGVHVVSVVVAVSAQDARGLHALEPVPPALIAAQFAALERAPIAAYRVGAVASVGAVEAIARALAGTQAPIVWDPVLGASAGGTFGGPDVLDALRDGVMPLVTLVTPNLAEAAALIGGPPATSVAAMESAARALVARGAAAALVTGGHLEGDPVDVLAQGTRVRRFGAPRIGARMRGTGCTLAAVIAAELAAGRELDGAIEIARAAVRERIAAARAIGDMFV